MNVTQTETQSKLEKPSSTKKYKLNLFIIFLVAFGFTAFTLFTDGNLDAVIEAFSQANLWIIALILLVMGLNIFFEAVILFILARLYTTRYSIKRAINNFFIGAFFSHITPSGTGGQFAQAYAFSRQGMDIANAASILVMHFLLSQIAQVVFGGLALIFRFEKFLSITEAVNFGSISIPIIYLSLLGFLINFLVIFFILILAKSRFIHRTIVNSIVALLGKLKLLKNAEAVKSNLSIQIENFRIESKRLQSNTPVTVVLFILFFLRLSLTYSIPYLSAVALPTIDLSQTNLLDGVFMTAYLNVIIYFAPLPGSVGFSEFFFSYLFQSLFGGYAQTIAPQLIWRGVTFYLTLIIGAISVIAFNIGNKDAKLTQNTQTFVELQKSTIEIRRQTAELMFSTGEMSSVKIRNRFSKMARDFFGFKPKKLDRYGNVIHTDEINKKKLKDK
ncbi:MAG: lysylphosphatidylglycerol synthase transmembrane domain-containing protein [Bacilli bacterium]